MKHTKLYNKILSLLFCLTLVLSSVPAPAQAAETETPQIKNVIFMVADGGGYGHYDIANYIRKTYGGLNPEKYPNSVQHEVGTSLFLEDYLIGSRTSFSINGDIIDSAASGSTLQTGVLPNNGSIAVDADKKPRATLLEAAMNQGKSAGVVTNTMWYDATPATTSAHALHRTQNEYEIYRQMLNKGLDVVLTSGFQNLTEKHGVTNQTAIDKGYEIVTSRNEVLAIEAGDKVWGGRNYGCYHFTRPSDEATLAEYTQAAITALSDDEDGFFLLVEDTFPDSAGHSNNAVVSTNYMAFDDAFQVAVEWAQQRTDTIVIATPDHDTGGVIFPEDEEVYKAAMEEIYNGVNPTSFKWESQTHTTNIIPVWLYAPEGIGTVPGLSEEGGDTPEKRANYCVDITDIAPYVADVMDADLDALTEELFVDVTDNGVYFPAEEKFLFANTANGEKYVYAFEPAYYLDGERIETGFKEAILVNDRFYVPKEMLAEGDLDVQGEKFDGILGAGTEEDPYLIKNVYDFIEFTNNLEDGTDYAGMYFEQTADLDLASYADEYDGALPTAVFAGIYNGAGYTINATITSTTGNTLFPKVSGTIMNLGVTGSVSAAGTMTAGLARTLLPAGKIVNCYSVMNLTAKRAAGLVYGQYGIVSNSYFGGTITADTRIALANTYGNGKYENCYYNAAYPQRVTSGAKKKALADMQTAAFAEILNTGRAAASKTVGVEEKAIATWETAETGCPTQYIPQPIVTEVVVTPAAVALAKGESVQLTAIVFGENNPSQGVTWFLEPASTAGTTLTADGLLTISETETYTSFTVMAKAKDDGRMVGACKVTVTE